MRLYGPEKSWNMMGEKKETQNILWGRKRESLHLKYSLPEPLKSLDVAGPGAKCLEHISSPPLPLQHAGEVIHTEVVRPLWQQPGCWNPEAFHSPPAEGESPLEYWKRNSPFLCAEFGETEG